MKLPQHIAGLSATAPYFDAYFLDQFGVLHDGRQFYPCVAEALENLHAAGKKLIVLTNSGKRAAPNLQRLVKMGVAEHCIAHVVSSGEVAWRCIRAGVFGAPFTAGRKVFVIGRADDDYGLDGLRLHFVQNPEKADFLLILGSNAPQVSLADYAGLMAGAARRGIPALCANPDIWMLSGAGRVPAPGAIAATYGTLGGRVTFIGKPYAAIYAQAFDLCGGIAKNRVLAVGDSVKHDIRGAADFGISSMLVRTGVLADMKPEALAALYETEDVWPDYVMPAFVW